MFDLILYRYADENGRVYRLFNNLRPKLMLFLAISCYVALC